MWGKFTKSAERQFFKFLATIRPPRPLPPPSHPRTIVALSCTGIGDALFDSAAVRCLKLGFPTAHLVVVAHRRRMTVARHNPFADEVLPYSKSPLQRLWLYFHIKRKHPDLVVALRVNEDATALGYLLNRHAFFGSIQRCKSFAFLLSNPTPAANNPHAVEETLNVARHAGGSKDAPPAMIYQVSPDERTQISQRFADWINAPYIVWQAGGGKSLQHRDWPPQKIAEAIRTLQQHIPHRFIITGGRDNEPAAAEISRLAPTALNLCSATTLEETAALVAGAALLVSSDTGVMHIGFATSTPTVALLHPRSKPELYGPPTGDPRFTTIHLSHDASMDNLSVETVTQTILEKLRA